MGSGLLGSSGGTTEEKDDMSNFTVTLETGGENLKTIDKMIGEAITKHPGSNLIQIVPIQTRYTWYDAESGREYGSTDIGMVLLFSDGVKW
jgi:hypothetical protein